MSKLAVSTLCDLTEFALTAPYYNVKTSRNNLEINVKRGGGGFQKIPTPLPYYLVLV